MKYKFVGNGRGIPGLPHEVSDEDVKVLGMEEVLKAALKNGNYVKVEEKKSKVEKE